MLNTDEIDRFEYVRHEETTLDTPLGKLRTILYTSHRPAPTRRLISGWRPLSITCRRAPSSA